MVHGIFGSLGTKKAGVLKFVSSTQDGVHGRSGVQSGLALCQHETSLIDTAVDVRLHVTDQPLTCSLTNWQELLGCLHLAFYE
jgi:hypothetical protein